MVKVAEEWFAICAGCEVSILDIGELLLDLLPKLEFVHIPVLMDHKLYGQMGEKTAAEIPQADVGIITGGIRNEEHRHLAKEMRAKCKTIIGLGACATTGGIPALANMYVVNDLYEKVYRGSKTTDSAPTPNAMIPPLTDRVYAVSEVIKVDLEIPGCPPVSDHIADALVALLEGKPWKLPERSVCDDCPTKREKKALTKIKRPLSMEGFTPGQPLDQMRCFNETGYLCLGPATKSGCGGHAKIPRCVKGYMPCRGCMGPIRAGANPMIDMMSALSSIGLDPKEIPDRMATFNRYMGAQGKLKPMPAKK
jgi:F420-non-reducing hydrogenase small subunit